MQAFELTILNWIRLTCAAAFWTPSWCQSAGSATTVGVDLTGGDPAGESQRPESWDLCGLRVGSGSSVLQPRPQAAHRPGTALRRQPHRLLADPAACGRLLPLRPHGSLLRIGGRAENSEQPPLEASTGAGRGHRPVPAVPLRPLAHRYSWGRCCGYSGRLAGNKAGAVISPEKSVKKARKHLTCFRVSLFLPFFREIRAVFTGLLKVIVVLIFLAGHEVQRRCPASCPCSGRRNNRPRRTPPRPRNSPAGLSWCR